MIARAVVAGICLLHLWLGCAGQPLDSFTVEPECEQVRCGDVCCEQGELCNAQDRCAQPVDWALQSTSPVTPNQFDAAFSPMDSALAVDGDGNVFVTGCHKAGFSLGSEAPLSPDGESDLFVAKLAPTGELQWIQSAGSPLADCGSSIAVVDDHVFVGGRSQCAESTVDMYHQDCDIFVSKLSARDGAIDWVTLAGQGPGDDRIVALSVADDELVVGGHFEQQLTVGETTLEAVSDELDFFVAKLSAKSGDVVWATRGGGDGIDMIQTTAVGADGKIFILGPALSDAQLSWGSTGVTAEGAGQIFVARLSATGQFEWVVLAGSVGDREHYRDEAGDLLVASDGLFVVGALDVLGESPNRQAEDPHARFGAHRVTLDASYVFVSRLSLEGEYLWVNVGGGGNAYRNAAAAAADAQGRLYVTGRYMGANLGTGFMFGRSSFAVRSTNLFLCGVSPDDGTFLWGRYSVTSGMEAGWDLAVDAGGTPHVVGSFSGAITLGKTPLDSGDENHNELFVWKVGEALERW